MSKRFTSFLLAIIMVISLIPSTSLIASADSDFNPNAGGGGTDAGGTGNWNAQCQGYRISLMSPQYNNTTGKPIYTSNKLAKQTVSKPLDLLFSPKPTEDTAFIWDTKYEKNGTRKEPNNQVLVSDMMKFKDANGFPWFDSNNEIPTPIVWELNETGTKGAVGYGEQLADWMTAGKMIIYNTNKPVNTPKPSQPNKPKPTPKPNPSNKPEGTPNGREATKNDVKDVIDYRASRYLDIDTYNNFRTKVDDSVTNLDKAHDLIGVWARAEISRYAGGLKYGVTLPWKNDGVMVKFTEAQSVTIRDALYAYESIGLASYKQWDNNQSSNKKPSKSIKADEVSFQSQAIQGQPKLSGGFISFAAESNKKPSNKDSENKNQGYLDEILTCKNNGKSLIEMDIRYFNTGAPGDKNPLWLIDNNGNKVPSGTDQNTINTIETVRLNNLLIFVEPIWWLKPTNAAGGVLRYYIYGTLTNIAEYALYLDTLSGWDNKLTDKNGKKFYYEETGKYGHFLGGFQGTFNSTGYQCLHVKRPVEIVISGQQKPEEIMNPVPWLPPSLPLENMIERQFGYMLHVYEMEHTRELEQPDIPTTHTFDNPKTPGPAPKPDAPEPSETELVKIINKDREPSDQISKEDLRKTTIIKVYTDRQLEEDGGYTDTPVGTFVRQGNPDNIIIEQETDYRMDEWYDIRSDKPENKDMGNLVDGGEIEPPFNWNELEGTLNSIFDDTEIEAGNPKSNEDIRLDVAPDEITSTKRVVYIHLIKTIKPVIEAKLTESQVSKVIGTAENIDSKTEGLTGPWGSYTMDIHLDQLTPSSHLYTVHAGCSKKNCTDPCCDDYSSTCSAISRINGDNKISWTYGVQNAASKVVLEAPGTNFNNIVKSSTNIGNTIKFDETVDDGEYTRQFNSDSQASNGLVAYQTIWRGNQDNLTLANYKKQSMGATFDILNESSTITGKPVIPAKNSNPTPRKSNGKHAELLETSLLVTQADTLVIGRCLGGGLHHTIATVQQNATMTQELKFKVPITIYTYSGAIAGTAGTPSKASPALTAALTNKTATTNNKSQGRIDLSINQTQSPLTFSPYIRMSYRITEDGIDNSHVKNDKGLSERTAYILSDKQSSIIPNNGVEISWYNGTQLKNGYGLQLNSKQWSMHKKATEAPAKEKNPWQGKDKVLPGGALYELGTAGTESVVTSTTYSTFVDQTSRNWISVNDKNKYTIPSITAANNQYITEFRGNLENFRIVQQVTELNGKKSVEISAGNQETLQSGVKTSNDSKYLLTNGTGTNGIMEADLDIIKEVYQTTIYKCFTDTEGNVYLATASQGTGNIVITQQDTEKLAKSLESICGTNKGSAVRIGTKGQTAAQILTSQSPAIKSMNNKTGLISNVVNSVERNAGNDIKAAWVTDGHWYNEAYDGSYVIAQTVQCTVGLGVPNKRIAILDPALCPKSTGKGDIFTKAYTSQFKVSSKSTTAPAGTNPGYVGTFDTMTVEIPGIQNMFMSKTFSIPNATVQDLS